MLFRTRPFALAHLVFAFLALWSSVLASDAPPKPFLSPLFSSHMVLQRERSNPIWGWSKPGSVVTVRLAGAQDSAIVADDGRWQAVLPPMPAGGPFELAIEGPEKMKLDDVLVGDVWLCSGQSNMLFGLSRVNDGAKEVAAANYPEIRLFAVGSQIGYSRSEVPSGSWNVCTPATAGGGNEGGFSAIAYFFAREVQAKTHVPIGLIQAAVGGSPVESWMDPDDLRRHGHFVDELDLIASYRKRGLPSYGNYLSHWFDDYDAGQKAPAWSSIGIDDSSWKTVPLTKAFAAFGIEAYPSVLWLRREVELPQGVENTKATLHLGMVEKMDTAFINGTWVGASSWVENPRVYPIPPGVLKPGKNLIVLRVLKITSPNGFLDAPERLFLETGSGAKVPLDGDWRARLSVDARAPHPLPPRFENYPTMPTVLYQGMIEPLVPVSLAGVLWYQGEANFTKAHEYRSLLPEMIHQWRARFGREDLPFYIVGLPAFMARRDQPGEDGWADLRGAQALTAASTPHTGFVNTIDTGDEKDIHPRDKKKVGERLAACVLSLQYHIDTAYEGPVFAKATFESGRGMRIQFSDTKGGLRVAGEKLRGFALAGADGHWHWADAVIEGDTVLVSSPDVPAPVNVRYAWQANPEATLFGGNGIPAGPFRTDGEASAR